MPAREVEREARWFFVTTDARRQDALVRMRVSDTLERVWYCPRCLGRVERRTVESPDDPPPHLRLFLDECLAGCGWQDWPYGSPESFKEPPRAVA